MSSMQSRPAYTLDMKKGPSKPMPPVKHPGRVTIKADNDNTPFKASNQ